MNHNLQREAQVRVDRISAFRSELAELEREEALRLTPEQRAGLEAHHQRLLGTFNREYGIDLDDSAKRISWGMRIVSLLGAVAFFAGFVLFLHRIWGLLPFAAQAGVLVVVPLILLVVAAWSFRRCGSSYYTALLALAAGAAFVMGLSATGAILNLAPSPHALLAWGAFGVLTGYAWNLRLMLGGGLVLLGGYAGAWGAMAEGAFWGSFMERPLWVLPAAAVFYMIPVLARQERSRDFEFVYRACGAGLALTSLLVLSMREHACCSESLASTVQMLYQLVGLGLSLAVVGHGLHLGRGGLVNLGSAGFVVFLLIRLHAWWWDWMPKYLFCLCIGLTAMALLVAFRGVRRRLGRRPDLETVMAAWGSAPRGVPNGSGGGAPGWLWVAAAAVMVAANLGGVVSGFRNRSGAPGGTLELTERELRLPGLFGESTVLLLGLQWAVHPSEPHEPHVPAWLTAAKLEELGFDCREPLTNSHAPKHYNSMAARSAYLVLELDGPASEEASRPAKPRTHLLAVDVGRAPATLRERYPDTGRHAIVRALIRPFFQTHHPVDHKPLAEPRLGAQVQELLPSQVFVPRPFNAVLQRLGVLPGERGDDGGLPPRYVVTVSWGAHYEPWVRSVRLLPAPSSGN